MINISESVLSSFGKVTCRLFDEYSIYKCLINEDLIESYLPSKLRAFPSRKKSDFLKRKFFYSKGIILASRSQVKQSFEEISHLISIADLFKHLFNNSNDIERYNFVLTGQYLIFCRIPHLHHVTYHLLCKHITLANRSDDVRFAGEFWSNENGIVLLNNNSGTYRPLNNQIDRLVALFNQLFPWREFQGISFEESLRPSSKQRLLLRITQPMSNNKSII